MVLMVLIEEGKKEEECLAAHNQESIGGLALALVLARGVGGCGDVCWCFVVGEVQHARRGKACWESRAEGSQHDPSI